MLNVILPYCNDAAPSFAAPSFSHTSLGQMGL